MMKHYDSAVAVSGDKYTAAAGDKYTAAAMHQGHEHKYATVALVSA